MSYSQDVLSTPTKTPLSRDVVVDRALQLAEAEGLPAVTIRRLAQEFGVTPMALYWHFRKKDDLLAGLGQRLLERVELPEVGSQAWPERLRALLEAVLDALRDHPATAPLAAAQIVTCERGLDLTERTLEVLADAGFTPDQSAQIASRALQTIIGLVTQTPGVEVGASPEDLDKHHRAKRAALASLSPLRYPRVVAAAPALTACADEDAYLSMGLELLVAGVLGLATDPARPT